MVEIGSEPAVDERGGRDEGLEGNEDEKTKCTQSHNGLWDGTRILREIANLGFRKARPLRE